MAIFANAESAGIDALERAVHLFQQAHHLLASALSQNIGKARASGQQLLADAVNVGRVSDCHD
jgi:hypothetical protein